jgi:hypothetical protein
MTDFNLNAENFIEGDPDAYKDQFSWMELIDDADFTYPLTTIRIEDDLLIPFSSKSGLDIYPRLDFKSMSGLIKNYK